MNYQKRPPEEVLNILKRHVIDPDSLSYYAWPELFSSTAGPQGGIGGQAMSTFTIEAWLCEPAGPTVFTCAGMFYVDHEPFVYGKRVKHWIRIPE